MQILPATARPIQPTVFVKRLEILVSDKVTHLLVLGFAQGIELTETDYFTHLWNIDSDDGVPTSVYAIEPLKTQISHSPLYEVSYLVNNSDVLARAGRAIYDPINNKLDNKVDFSLYADLVLPTDIVAGKVRQAMTYTQINYNGDPKDLIGEAMLNLEKTNIGNHIAQKMVVNALLSPPKLAEIIYTQNQLSEQEYLTYQHKREQGHKIYDCYPLLMANFKDTALSIEHINQINLAKEQHKQRAVASLPSYTGADFYKIFYQNLSEQEKRLPLEWDNSIFALFLNAFTSYTLHKDDSEPLIVGTPADDPLRQVVANNYERTDSTIDNDNDNTKIKNGKHHVLWVSIASQTPPAPAVSIRDTAGQIIRQTNDPLTCLLYNHHDRFVYPNNPIILCLIDDIIEINNDLLTIYDLYRTKTVTAHPQKKKAFKGVLYHLPMFKKSLLVLANDFRKECISQGMELKIIKNFDGFRNLLIDLLSNQSENQRSFAPYLHELPSKPQPTPLQAPPPLQSQEQQTSQQQQPPATPTPQAPQPTPVAVPTATPPATPAVNEVTEPQTDTQTIEQPAVEQPAVEQVAPAPQAPQAGEQAPAPQVTPATQVSEQQINEQAGEQAPAPQNKQEQEQAVDFDTNNSDLDELITPQPPAPATQVATQVQTIEQAPTTQVGEQAGEQAPPTPVVAESNKPTTNETQSEQAGGETPAPTDTTQQPQEPQEVLATPATTPLEQNNATQPPLTDRQLLTNDKPFPTEFTESTTQFNDNGTGFSFDDESEDISMQKPLPQSLPNVFNIDNFEQPD